VLVLCYIHRMNRMNSCSGCAMMRAPMWLLLLLLPQCDDARRFKTDAADLEFVEKVARWLTNTQVQIKSEVTSSNSESMAIDQSLGQLESLVNCCEQADIDDSTDVCINQSINQSLLFQAAWLIETQDRQDRQVLTDSNKSKDRE